MVPMCQAFELSNKRLDSADSERTTPTPFKTASDWNKNMLARSGDLEVIEDLSEGKHGGDESPVAIRRKGRKS